MRQPTRPEPGDWNESPVCAWLDDNRGCSCLLALLLPAIVFGAMMGQVLGKTRVNSAYSHARSQVSDLEKAIFQYMLDHSVPPSLGPDPEEMTQEELLVVLFETLDGAHTGTTCYYDFKDDQVIGGLSGWNSAQAAETGLPLGTLVDCWGSPVRYVPYRRRRKPSPVHDPHHGWGWLIWSLGPDGRDLTGDEIWRWSPEW